MIASSLQGLVLVALLLMAVYVSIGRILISRIDQYTSDFESILSNSLNVPVSITSLKGQWNYFDPKLYVENLRLGPDISPAVVIADLTLGLDTFASIFEGRVVISEINIQGLNFTVQRDDERFWFIRGMPRSGKGFNAEPILDNISHLNEVQVNNVSIDMLGRQHRYRISSAEDQEFELKVEDGIKSLSWPLRLEYLSEPSKQTAQIHFLGQYKGDPRDNAFESELYLSLPIFELNEFLPDINVSGISLSEVSASGQFWLTSSAARGLEIKGLPIIKTVVVERDQDKVQVLSDIELEFLASGNLYEGGFLQISKMTGRVAGEIWQLKDISSTFLSAPSGMELAVSVPPLSAKKIAKTLVQLDKRLALQSPEFGAMIEGLNFRGEINDLLIYGFYGKDRSDFKITAMLDEIKFDEYKQGLSLTNLDGFASLSPLKGYVDIHNERRFGTHFPALFSNPWTFDSSHGRIHYEFQGGELKLHSSLFVAKEGDVIAKGRLHINLPADVHARTWGLELGILNADLLDAELYLPNILTEELRLWIKQSIIGGLGKTNGLVFHGSLGKLSAKNQKSFEMFSEVENVILDYDEHWPRFDDISARLYIGAQEISSEGISARVFDSIVTDVDISVPLAANGLPDTLLIDGQIAGPFSDGLRLLSETPIYGLTNEMSKSWQAMGDMSGRASLNIPLGLRLAEEVYVDVKVQLADSTLFIPEFDIDISQLSGSFSFDSKKGLNTKRFSAKLLGKEIIGSMETLGDQSGGLIDLKLKGSVDTDTLYKWSGESLLTRWDGLIYYDSNLHIPYGKRSQEPLLLEVRSDLVGITSHMPSPLAKKAEEKMSFKYRQTFLDSGFSLALSLGQEFKAQLQVMDDKLRGGRIHFGSSPMESIGFDQLKASGEIAKVSYDNWDVMISELQALSDPSLENNLYEILDVIDVRVGLLDTYGFELDDVKMQIRRSPDAWKVNLDSEILVGLVTIADDINTPLDLNLESLTLESSDDGGDPLLDIDPSEILEMNVRLEKLTLGEEDYGYWSFHYRPVASGAEVKNLFAKVKGLELLGDGQILWSLVDAKHSSKFKGRIQVSDLAFSLKEWGYASSIEGKDFSFLSDVSWPGSPAMMDLEIISGISHLTHGEGRFVQAESDVGALKLLGIFDFASLAKRFRLDFSDVVDKGFSFNRIKGSTRFNRGIVDVTDPIVIVGSSSTFKIAGRLDFETEILDGDIVMTLPVDRNLPWYAAYSAFATGPLSGMGVFIIQKLFRKQIAAISSAKYKVHGTIDEPVIEFVSFFNNTVRDVPAEGSLLKEAEGSLPQKAEGSLLEEAEGSLSEEAEGSLPQKAEGSLLKEAEGSLSEEAEGSTQD